MTVTVVPDDLTATGTAKDSDATTDLVVGQASAFGPILRVVRVVSPGNDDDREVVGSVVAGWALPRWHQTTRPVCGRRITNGTRDLSAGERYAGVYSFTCGQWTRNGGLEAVVLPAGL